MSARWSSLVEIWLGSVTHPDLIPLAERVHGVDAGGTLRVAQFRRDFVSRGQTYRAAAFRFRPPEQGGPDNTISLNIDNIDGEITAVLGAIRGTALVSLEKVFAHAPDEPTVAYTNLRLLNAGWNRDTVTSGVGRRRTSGPLMGLTVNPAEYPAAFTSNPAGTVPEI